MFAIDIGTTSLKAVRLADLPDDSGRIVVEAAALHDSEDGWVEGNFAAQTFGDRPALLAALRDLADRIGARGCPVALSLPDQFVKVFFLSLDRLQDVTPAERKYTEWRLRQQLPGRVAEGCVLDYQVLSTLRDDDGVEIRLLVQLVREEVLNAFAELLLDAGMEPRFVNCDSVATLNLAEEELRRRRESTEGSDVCLLHVGNESTTFHFTRLETTEWIRILDYGCRHFRDRLVEACDLAPAEARRHLAAEALIPGAPPGEGELVETLGRFHVVFEEWFREIGSTFDHYRSHHPSIGTLPVLLCGGGTVLRNLPDFLGSLLERPVSLLDPGSLCRFPSHVSEDETMRFLPAVGMGVAAREAERENRLKDEAPPGEAETEGSTP